ncbi:MAG: hypothetical protein ACLT1O_04765 [Bifidobacterium pseudocatenulatum]
MSRPMYSGPVTPAFGDIGDGLGDGDDMGLVERGLQRRSAVAGGAEGDTVPERWGRDDVIVLADDTSSTLIRSAGVAGIPALFATMVTILPLFCVRCA